MRFTEIQRRALKRLIREGVEIRLKQTENRLVDYVGGQVTEPAKGGKRVQD